ncbi:MAG TPA: VOC family protein [Microbacterium sp.]|nr:VOC family protein [Microbacterium sp.]
MTSIFVDDQRAALAFYTDVLGFQKYHDIPIGTDSWLTVVSPEQPEGPELLIEPAEHPAKRAFRDAMVEEGTPMVQFTVDDVHAEHERLVTAGVTFVQPPTDVGAVIAAVFDDTCGNLVQIVTPAPSPTPTERAD